MAQVVIVSGPPGAGKSSVCEALCARYDRTVHLETDDVYDWLRMGFLPPWKDGSQRQNAAASRAAARAASAFAEDQYGVFVDGVISPVLLQEYLRELRPAGVPVHYVVLLPPLAEVRRRAAGRDKFLPWPEDVWDQLYAMFSTPDGGVTIDRGGLSAEETADRVMDACGRGVSLVSA